MNTTQNYIQQIFLTYSLHVQSVVIEIRHDDKLPEDSVAYLQCALLYTSVSGQRRLRIHNLALSTCSQLTDLFRCCEMDTFTNYVAKHGMHTLIVLNVPIFLYYKQILGSQLKPLRGKKFLIQQELHRKHTAHKKHSIYSEQILTRTGIILFFTNQVFLHFIALLSTYQS